MRELQDLVQMIAEATETVKDRCKEPASEAVKSQLQNAAYELDRAGYSLFKATLLMTPKRGGGK